MTNSCTAVIGTRAPNVRLPPAEEELVRRIHRKVGGPSKLSTYDDPAKVRKVVIEALATEEIHSKDRLRIQKGELSVFERRVVRTVTNRGAAVRSRLRIKKEVTKLREELRERDRRVKALEDMVTSMCHRYGISYPTGFLIKNQTPTNVVPAELQQAAPTPVEASPIPHGESESTSASRTTSAVSSAPVVYSSEAPDVALDQILFGGLIDQMITPIS